MIPVDCSPPGSSVHRILQARILEWVAVPFFGDLPNSGIKPGSPTLQADPSPSEPPGKPLNQLTELYYMPVCCPAAGHTHRTCSFIGSKLQRVVMFPGMLRCTIAAIGDCRCGQGSLFGAGSGVQGVRVECSLGSGTAGGKNKFQN